MGICLPWWGWDTLSSPHVPAANRQEASNWGGRAPLHFRGGHTNSGVMRHLCMDYVCREFTMFASSSNFEQGWALPNPESEAVWLLPSVTVPNELRRLCIYLHMWMVYVYNIYEYSLKEGRFACDHGMHLQEKISVRELKCTYLSTE